MVVDFLVGRRREEEEEEDEEEKEDEEKDEDVLTWIEIEGMIEGEDCKWRGGKGEREV